jgi:hypothetical protein
MNFVHKILFALAIVLVLIVAKQAEAGNWRILIGSAHFGDDPQTVHTRGIARLATEHGVIVLSDPGKPDKFCEFNPGIGYTADSGFGWLAYRNSYCDPALAVGWETPHWKRINLVGGFMFGYEVSPILPYAAVKYTIGHVEISASPYVGKREVSFVVNETGVEYATTEKGKGFLLALSLKF